MHQRNDLLIFSDVLMLLPRTVFTIIYRQPAASHQRIMRDAMFGHPSAVLIDYLKSACEREQGQNVLDTLMPSTALHAGDRLLGNETSGIWCSHDQRMYAQEVRWNNYIAEHGLRANIDFLELNAFDPTFGGQATQYNEAARRALGRDVGAFVLKVIPNLVYRICRTPTARIAFNTSYVANMQAHDMLLCKAIRIFPSTDDPTIPDFVISGVSLTDSSNPGIEITKEHLQCYTGRMRGADRMHHAQRGDNEVQASTLPLAGADDDSVNQKQGSRVACAIGDGKAVWACGQVYTQVGRVANLNDFCMTGLGVLYHYEDGAIVWHDEEFVRITEQHCEALLWWREQGYFTDEQLERYAPTLARAENRQTELNRRTGAGQQAFYRAAQGRSDLYP